MSFLPGADDTGPGKTVEAGIIICELRLRPGLRTIVAAVGAAGEWKGEMEEHCGLLFRTVDRRYPVIVRRDGRSGTSAWFTPGPLPASHPRPPTPAAPAGEARAVRVSRRL